MALSSVYIIISIQHYHQYILSLVYGIIISIYYHQYTALSSIQALSSVYIINIHYNQYTALSSTCNVTIGTYTEHLYKISSPTLSRLAVYYAVSYLWFVMSVNSYSNSVEAYLQIILKYSFGGTGNSCRQCRPDQITIVPGTFPNTVQCQTLHYDAHVTSSLTNTVSAANRLVQVIAPSCPKHPTAVRSKDLFQTTRSVRAGLPPCNGSNMHS